MFDHKIELTDKQIKWLTLHFKNTKNVEIAKKLGISMRSVNRFAQKLGLTKTKQFMKKCQRATADAALQSHLKNGTFPPKGYIIPRSEEFRFKKGETMIGRFGAKKVRERNRKAAASRKLTYWTEKARVSVGLPQKTRLKVVCQPPEKIHLRSYLKKQGYIVDDEAKMAYYTDTTRRGKRIEAKKQSWYQFGPLPITEQ